MAIVHIKDKPSYVCGDCAADIKCTRPHDCQGDYDWGDKTWVCRCNHIPAPTSNGIVPFEVSEEQRAEEAELKRWSKGGWEIKDARYLLQHGVTMEQADEEDSHGVHTHNIVAVLSGEMSREAARAEQVRRKAQQQLKAS